MPYRKPKRSYVLPVVTTLAVAAPLAALTMSDSPDYRATTGTELAAVPAQLAEVVLNSAPDIVLPLRELTGLDLPDLHLSDLRMLPLPASIPIPDGLPLPPGVQLPKEIPLPKLNGPHPATPGQQSAPAPNTAPGSNATPGQGLAPGQTPFPGQATAPTQNSFPGQATTSNQNNIPGRAAPNSLPGQAAAPTQNSIPGQAIAPGQNPNPGQAAAPAQNPLPGQAAAPAQNPVPGQVAAPSQIPSSGQTAPAPTQSAPGGARFIADPSHLEPGTTPDTPALAPGAVPPELTDQVGAQVKELSRETPFSVVALTAADLTNTKAMLRARQSDGSWGPWFNAEPVDTRRTDRAAAGGKTGTEPLYVGTTNAVQMLVTRKNAAATAPDGGGAPDPAAQPAPRSDDPAQMSGVDLTAVLIDPGRGAIDGALHKVAAPAPGGGPKVISREGWGADESIRCEEPTYDDGPGKDGLGGITVHHTAGRNDYTEEESAGIVRAIYTYHAKTLGWCDIGYNALVDKYGQIFEGRAGGLDRAVQGAHAGGFNENTAGVALMGNYTQDPPTEESIEAIGNFIGWRAKIAHLNPQGKTIMYSEGTEYTSYAMGQAVNLPIVFAHRDVGNTTCPGDAAYEQMDRIREIAASVAGGAGVTNSGNGDGTDSYANNGTGTDGTANSPAPQAAPRNKPDLSTLAALTEKLLGMVNENPIAKHWADNGGPRGPLGAAQTEPLPAAQGQQYAKFANGYVYTAPDGKVIEVLGKILDRFLQLGGDAGVLGLPTSDAYNVPNGQRADFQYGSLILNQVTGIVTTVWKTYNDTYQQDAGRPVPAAAPAPVPAPAGSPAPAEFPTPEAPAPAPQPDALQFPTPADFLPTPAPEPAG